LGSGSKAIQPESTIESYDRRNFVRKAALASASAGIGATLLGKKNLFPESEAKTDCLLAVTTCNPNISGFLAVWKGTSVISDSACACYECAIHGSYLYGTVKTTKPPCPVLNPLGATLTITNTCTNTDLAPVGVAGLTEDICYSCWPVVTAGVVGSADYGYGVSGASKKGIGVYAAALGPSATPIVAQGSSGQKANLQEWLLGKRYEHSLPLSVVAANGFFGIGTCTPAALMDVNGTISGSKMGLGTTCPGTTLQVAGSISAKAKTVSTTYPMGSTDFAVLANASSAPFAVTLPAAETAAGMIVFVKKTDSSGNVVTVQGAGTGPTQDTIEGTTSLALNKHYASLTLISNGAPPPGEWYIISNAT
jgi:hypothetical protein